MSNTLNGVNNSNSVMRLEIDYRDNNSKISKKPNSIIENRSNIIQMNNNYKAVNSSPLVNSVSVEESLQIFETLLTKHLGTDYIRSVIYSHYGSWLPKYGTICTDQSNKSATAIELSKMVDAGDWLSYFQTRQNIDYNTDNRIIRNYIFSRNRYVPSAAGSNYADLVYWSSKKLQYRPTDSFISLSSVTLSDQIFHKVWN